MRLRTNMTVTLTAVQAAHKAPGETSCSLTRCTVYTVVNRLGIDAPSGVAF